MQKGWNSESFAGFKRHVDELYGSVQAWEERQAELQEGQNRSLDKLEAILELLQSVREHEQSRPPYRAPPIPSG